MVALFWNVVAPLGGGASLEEVCHRGQNFKIHFLSALCFWTAEYCYQDPLTHHHAFAFPAMMCCTNANCEAELNPSSLKLLLIRILAAVTRKEMNTKCNLGILFQDLYPEELKARSPWGAVHAAVFTVLLESGHSVHQGKRGGNSGNNVATHTAEFSYKEEGVLTLKPLCWMRQACHRGNTPPLWSHSCETFRVMVSTGQDEYLWLGMGASVLYQ